MLGFSVGGLGFYSGMWHGLPLGFSLFTPALISYPELACEGKHAGLSDDKCPSRA